MLVLPILSLSTIIQHPFPFARTCLGPIDSSIRLNVPISIVQAVDLLNPYRLLFTARFPCWAGFTAGEKEITETSIFELKSYSIGYSCEAEALV